MRTSSALNFCGCSFMSLISSCLLSPRLYFPASSSTLILSSDYAQDKDMYTFQAAVDLPISSSLGLPPLASVAEAINTAALPILQFKLEQQEAPIPDLILKIFIFLMETLEVKSKESLIALLKELSSLFHVSEGYLLHVIRHVSSPLISSYLQEHASKELETVNYSQRSLVPYFKRGPDDYVALDLQRSPSEKRGRYFCQVSIPLKMVAKIELLAQKGFSSIPDFFRENIQDTFVFRAPAQVLSLKSPDSCLYTILETLAPSTEEFEKSKHRHAVSRLLENRLVDTSCLSKISMLIKIQKFLEKNLFPPYSTEYLSHYEKYQSEALGPKIFELILLMQMDLSSVVHVLSHTNHANLHDFWRSTEIYLQKMKEAQGVRVLLSMKRKS